MTPALGLLSHDLKLGSESDFGGPNSGSSGNNSRWKLPEAMQIDLREITREAVEFLISHEQSMQGRRRGDRQIGTTSPPPPPQDTLL